MRLLVTVCGGVVQADANISINPFQHPTCETRLSEDSVLTEVTSKLWQVLELRRSASTHGRQCLLHVLQTHNELVRNVSIEVLVTRSLQRSVEQMHSMSPCTQDSLPRCKPFLIRIEHSEQGHSEFNRISRT